MCQQTGDFVCCEACPRSFHFNCTEPPVTEQQVAQMDLWYCNMCNAKRLQEQRKVRPSKGEGVFRASRRGRPSFCVCVYSRLSKGKRGGAASTVMPAMMPFTMPTGLFEQLAHQVVARNPVNFSLPVYIKEYFDGGI